MRPGDERGFIHKKLLGAVGSLAGVLPIPGGSFISTAARALSGRGRAPGPAQFGGARGFRTGRTVPRTQTARVSVFSRAEKELGKALKFGGGGDGVLSAAPGANRSGGCILPWRRAPDGTCQIFLGDRPGPDDVGGGNGAVVGPVGEAVMGRYGAAMQPGSMMIDRAVCGRKMQLADDGLCYSKSAITNKQRMWPRGRQPLLTGGDMRAISIANTAAKRLERTTKRLQSMGMMKKPTARARGHAHARAARGVVNV